MYGYNGTLEAHSQGTSGEAREEDAASVCEYNGTLYAHNQVELKRE